MAVIFLHKHLRRNKDWLYYFVKSYQLFSLSQLAGEHKVNSVNVHGTK